MSECIFCKIVRGEILSEEVLENDDFIVVKDAFPKVDGHLLIIPREHYKSFLDMPSGLYSGMLGMVKRVVEKLSIKDFNLVLNNGKVAGQIVPHVHLHILPREPNDDFKIGV